MSKKASYLTLGKWKRYLVPIVVTTEKLLRICDARKAYLFAVTWF